MKLTFMGTAGARFMVAKQLAASGGLYLEDGDTRISLDPGPGAIVQYAKRKVDLTKLDAIVISHRHLDHSSDVNVMIEAMTERSEEHTSELQSPCNLVCRLLLEKKKNVPHAFLMLFAHSIPCRESLFHPTPYQVLFADIGGVISPKTSVLSLSASRFHTSPRHTR